MRRFTVVGKFRRAPVSLAVLFAVACGTDVDSLTSSGDGGGTTSPQGSGDSGTGVPGYDAGQSSPDTGTGVTPIIDGCGGTRYDAQARQLDIYMIVDESGSMVPWWPFVLPAINQFLNAPEAAGIGVGMQLFGRSCNADDYATPRVPIAPLPGNAAAINAAFPILPTSGTATYPALQGAIKHARAWSSSHPDSKTVVLLVTDGIPSECNSNVNNVSEAAAEGFTGSPSIPTYVIGLPLLEPLNPIAVAGGTVQAYAADPSNSTALVATMNQIRGLALPCDYALPPDAGDRNLINLDYAPTQGAPMRIPQLASPDQCTSGAQGWYFDPQNQNRLVACEATCQTFKSGNGKVDVVLGCPTLR